jgi:formate dehydrogenase maturation protein FdhE
VLSSKHVPLPSRHESRDILELRRLRVAHPELEPAVDLQLGLLDLQRRVKSRVPLPVSALQVRSDEALAAGRPLLAFGELPLEWSDFRLALRETADLLLRFDVLEAADHQRLLLLSRDGHQLEPLVKAWFAHALSSAGRTETASSRSPDDAARFDQVFSLALRPFLMRCAEGLLPRLDLSLWTHGYCPLCGGDPELAVLVAPAGQRFLICVRCTGRWPFDESACPFCLNDDRRRLTALAGPDRRYRIDACDACLRYLKTYDERGADRPVLPGIDTIATLPLDAAAMQRGYR